MTPPASPLLSLCPEEVHLWYLVVDTERDPHQMAEGLRWLSGDELARYKRFFRERERLQFLRGRMLLRGVLSRYASVAPWEWQFVVKDHGKPVLASCCEPPLQFNLSHTNGLLACALTLGREVGVDVEEATKPTPVEGIVRRFFAPEEVQYILSHDGEKRREAFFELWTLKEAYIKARGKGLALPLSAFAIACEGTDSARLLRCDAEIEDAPDRWKFFRTQPTSCHKMAVAVAHQSGESLTFQVQPVELAGLCSNR